MQWDPDHDPQGSAVPRRAIQLGLRGAVLEAYGKSELLEVIDMSGFAATQRRQLSENGPSGLSLPVERVYRPTEAAVARHLGLD